MGSFQVKGGSCEGNRRFLKCRVVCKRLQTPAGVIQTAGLHDDDVAVTASFVFGIICPIVLKSDWTDSSHHAWHPHPLSSTPTPHPSIHCSVLSVCHVLSRGRRSCLCAHPEAAPLVFHSVLGFWGLIVSLIIWTRVRYEAV